MKKSLYMDCCCYNRPYDDMTQPRINYEAEDSACNFRFGCQ